MDVKKSILLEGVYSDLQIPQDVLFKNSEIEQEIPGHITFINDITITGQLMINHLNGIHFDTLCDLVTLPHNNYGLYGLEIDGNIIYFKQMFATTI